jgi:hypothetical protein
MPKFNFNPAKVALTKDTLAEASDLSQEIYTHIRAMAHGDEYDKNRSEALEKTETLYGLLGGK